LDQLTAIAALAWTRASTRAAIKGNGRQSVARCASFIRRPLIRSPSAGAATHAAQSTSPSTPSSAKRVLHSEAFMVATSALRVASEVLTWTLSEQHWSCKQRIAYRHQTNVPKFHSAAWGDRRSAPRASRSAICRAISVDTQSEP